VNLDICCSTRVCLRAWTIICEEERRSKLKSKLVSIFELEKAWRCKDPLFLGMPDAIATAPKTSLLQPRISADKALQKTPSALLYSTGMALEIFACCAENPA
jgi:hypothetical protein